METKPTFGKTNYILLIVGSLLVAVGYLMMQGGASTDPKVFNPEIFNAQRITYAPMTIVLGFIIILFGIMKKDSKTASE